MISIKKKIGIIKDKTGKQQRDMFNEILKTMKKDDRFSWSTFQNVIRGYDIRSEVTKTAVYNWVEKELELIKNKEK